MTKLDSQAARLGVIDYRTGKEYNIPVHENYVLAKDLANITSPDGPVPVKLRILDNGFEHTACVHSAITHIDGQHGTLRYRSIPIEDLFATHDFEDVAHLLLWSRLPSVVERMAVRKELCAAMNPPQNVRDTIAAFPRDAEAYTMVIAGLTAFIAADEAAVKTRHQHKPVYQGNLEEADKAIIRTIAYMTTSTALAYCHKKSKKFNAPEPHRSLIGNLLHMMNMHDEKVERALDKLWILYGDHEMTSSTAGFLHAASTLTDPISCLISAIICGHGPLHGGAISLAYETLEKIGHPKHVPAYIDMIKLNKIRLFGYGHRVYKTKDPRLVLIEQLLEENKEAIEANPLLRVAFEIDQIANQDEYFVSRQLKANVDLLGCYLYSALSLTPSLVHNLWAMSDPSGTKMASNDKRSLKLPGYGLPVNHMPAFNKRFPTIIGDEESVWKASTLVRREVCMLRFIEEITNKPNWWVKVHDPEITKRWKQEALEHDWASYRQHADFTPNMADACIEELRSKAKLYEDTGLIPVMDYAMCAIKSDKLMSAELQESLKKAVGTLEDVPEDHKDWHPGSDGKVLDLVHPSMWPLVYGRSRILPDKCVGLLDSLQYCGMGETIPVPKRRQIQHEDTYSSSSVDNSFSQSYQWLPCDVTIDEQGHPKIISYINNLHPVRHSHIYPVIEKFIEKSLPAWDVVLRWPEEYNLQRLEVTAVGTICSTPDLCDEWGCSQTSRPLNDDEEPRVEDEAWTEEYPRSEREVLDNLWFRETHKIDLPDIEESPYKYKGPAVDQVKTSGFFNGGSRIQVIIKLANIHLTPEKPTYDGGSWHVEGQINEHICATALFYYDCENITDSHLGFRTVADSEGLMGTLGYEQGDLDSIERTFAINPNGNTVQDIGSVLTREGRALFFPNVFQHRVSPFSLADPTRPGHRKILALFLVDPSIPIISTGNIPPQQKDWWLDATQFNSAVSSRLPAELAQMVADNVDFPFDEEEAKRIREEVIAERSKVNAATERKMLDWEWNFCEH
ncbi:Citrate synthase-like protein [Paramyrothecium foliicola]|nr:Citrate synthase-like protein [Paramyrothecium foliicola]